ncbi:T9SS type A sorting domain-containing protein [Saccharicrinis sp. 156]|uniref:T9SS type A sorting domain-containing protein n=1 Tax=Saccharicrinis sp. 156 TaxID=3417574 RepID=UPI003D336C74
MKKRFTSLALTKAAFLSAFIFLATSLRAQIIISYPVLTTSEASSVMATSAMLGGQITDDGGSAISARGVLYSNTETGPEFGGENVVVDVNTTVDTHFSKTVEGLLPNTTYYFRAYAYNLLGYEYGEVLSFTTSAQTATDIRYGEKTKFSAWPNPTRDFVNISGIESGSKFKVFSVTGNMVMDGQLESDKIDLSNLTNGVYVLVVGRFKIRVIKNNSLGLCCLSRVASL